MNAVIMTLAGLLVAILCALFAIPPLVDWNAYRGMFEEEVSRMIGRDVRVGGEVNLQLLPTPYLRFENVVIADAPGVTGEPLLRAGGFTVLLSVPPLLRGAIEARKVKLERPELRLRLDSVGGGNWQKLRLSTPSMGFAPTGVALQSVDITDGSIALESPNGDVIGTVTNITGELSAEALSGPYKFSGALDWLGAPRELRISTAAPEPDGSIQTKIVVRAPDDSSRYLLDGQFVDLATSPAFKGTVAADGTLAAEPAAKATAPPFDLKAGLEASAFGARLTDLIVSFEQGGRPQLLTGSATADWRDVPKVTATLHSRWLDLDRISGVGPDRGPIAVAQALTTRLVGLRRVSSRTGLTLVLDQATVAGEAVSDIVIDAVSDGSAFVLDRAAASMPGGTTGRLDGRLIAETDDRLTFDGTALLRGANAMRFARWVTPKGTALPLASGGAFATAGRLAITTESIRLREATLDLDGNTLSGDVAYGWGAIPSLAITLNADVLSLAPVLPGALEPSAVRALLAPGAQAGPFAGDLDITIDADRVSDGKNVYRAVRLDAARRSDRLDLKRFELGAGTPLAVSAAGTLERRGDAVHGRLAGRVGVAAASGLDELRRIVSGVFGDDWQPPADLALSPARFAYVLDVGADGETSRLALDGTVRGDRVALRLDAPQGFARTRPLAVELDLESDQPGATLALLAGGATGSDVVQPAAAPAERADQATGTIVARMLGTRDGGYDGLAVARLGADSRVVWRGRIMPGAPGEPPRLDGRAVIEVADVKSAAGRLGSRLTDALSSAALSADVAVSGTTRALVVDADQARFGEMTTSGQLIVERPLDGTPVRLGGKLAVDRLALPELLAVVLDRGDAASRQPSAQGIAELWSASPFALPRLAGLTGDVAFTANRLVVTDEIVVARAAGRLLFSDQRLDLRDLTAAAAGGGILAASVSLERAPAGVQLSGRIALDGVDLSHVAVVEGGEPFARGRLDLTAKVEGRALSPRALAAALRGSGKATISDVALRGIGANAVAEAVERMRRARIAQDQSAVGFGGLLPSQREATIDEPKLEQALAGALRQATVVIGARTLDFEVQDGALHLAALAVDGERGRIDNRISVDLTQLAFDSQWRITPKAENAATGQPLPAIDVIYVGRLDAIAETEPSIVSDALSRELAVRQMEGSVAELERLRREDEARARAEEQRLRELEAAQQAALEAERRRLEQQRLAPPTLLAPLPIPQSAPAPAPAPRAVRPFEGRSGLLKSGPISIDAAATTIPEAKLGLQRWPRTGGESAVAGPPRK